MSLGEFKLIGMSIFATIFLTLILFGFVLFHLAQALRFRSARARLDQLCAEFLKQLDGRMELVKRLKSQLTEWRAEGKHEILLKEVEASLGHVRFVSSVVGPRDRRSLNGLRCAEQGLTIACAAVLREVEQGSFECTLLARELFDMERELNLAKFAYNQQARVVEELVETNMVLKAVYQKSAWPQFEINSIV